MYFPISYKHYRNLSDLEVYDAAKVINSDGIHILVDMNTNSVQTEIFAFRPAPVQVSWIGYYPSRIGASFMDYLITDKICSPPGNEYTEKLAYVKDTVFVGDHRHMFKYFGREFYTRQQYDLPEDVVVFCNFSQPNKIDPHTFRMWIEILNQVSNSVLWLLRWNDDVEANIKAFAEKLGFDSSRIIFSDILNKDEHMRRIHLADIYLDTLIYNGNLACLDAISAEVPIITFPGETYTSRITASQLTALGYTDTIADSKEQYIRLAVQCGLNNEMLENIKRFFQELKMESNLFDTNSYALEISNILKKLWSEHELDKPNTVKLAQE